MANIPDIILLQATRRNLERAKTFQDEMVGYFFEHTMYDVKDAMSSILAVCDIEGMKRLPEVKKYIQRVNNLIEDVSLYNDRTAYNVYHILLNVMKILERAHKDQLSITYRIASVKAQARGGQAHLEQALLYMIIEAIQSMEPGRELNLEIDLSQKERDALITLKIPDHSYAEVVRKEILTVANQGQLKTQIFVKNSGSEVSIRLPLYFGAKADLDALSDRSLSLRLDDLKEVTPKVSV